MTAPLSDEQLKAWAREHLVYEGRMLAYAAARLADRGDLPRDQETNVLIESFVLHVRCLGDFLWGVRQERHPHDAFAADFCAPGVWERERGDLPPALAEVRDRRRTGREAFHLSYDRLEVRPAAKEWPVTDILAEIAYALDDLASYALPERLDEETRAALHDLFTHSRNVGPASVATGTHFAYPDAVISGS